MFDFWFIDNANSLQNDLFSAVSDIRSVNRLQQDSTDGYYRLATLLYRLGHVSDALKVSITLTDGAEVNLIRDIVVYISGIPLQRRFSARAPLYYLYII